MMVSGLVGGICTFSSYGGDHDGEIWEVGSLDQRRKNTAKSEGMTMKDGVDATQDGKIDHWGDWQEVKESYDRTPGFAKHVQVTPAELKLDGLPAGYGFCYQLKLTDSTDNKSKPMLNKVRLQLAE